MELTRREAMAGTCGGLAVLMGLPALTQKALAEPVYPSQAIKLIVPYPAGGTTDFLGRLVAEQLRTGLGASVVVENKPGVATALGAEQAARAAPEARAKIVSDMAATLSPGQALWANAINHSFILTGQNGKAGGIFPPAQPGGRDGSKTS